jgi:pentose-5-phosphate-3-epimerase
VQVDGGVSLETAPKLIALGVSNLVVGSAITRSHDVSAALAAFNALENPFGV